MAQAREHSFVIAGERGATGGMVAPTGTNAIVGGAVYRRVREANLGGKYGFMFRKLLIANRGEIACRIIKTARRMNIQTVAVYSEADRHALHVAMADEAVLLGPAAPSQSYLAGERIVQACRDSGAEAVHPGYGFLSENAAFAERLGEAGVTFIGPSAAAVQAMGDKVSSKRLARQAGVCTIPGGEQILRDAGHAIEAAREIGYPVMLKATAGGGGKGMRIVQDDAQCREAFARATSEAELSFGDRRLFVEKFIEEPRHIEIQVLADSHGNVIHLGERECSVQRRYQKIVEEAPSPLLDESTRTAMGEQAVQLARAVKYQSAGTVEFVVDTNQKFYFLEMNTRLQVEHPVTECVYGLDLVELMIRIAAGEPLPLTQSDLQRNGWAIEARVYAEDAARGFLPSSGRLTHYLPPVETNSVRIDSGLYEGAEMSLHYDPLIAKVVTHAATREQAVHQLSDALDQFYIRGVSHNVGFLAALVQHSCFREGRLDVGFVAREYPHGFDTRKATHPDPALLISVATAIHHRYAARDGSIGGRLAADVAVAPPRDWVVATAAEQYSVKLQVIEGGEAVTVGQDVYEIISPWQLGEPRFFATVNQAAVCIQVDRVGERYHLTHAGYQLVCAVLPHHVARLLTHIPRKVTARRSNYLCSPMPGLLAELRINVGHEFKQGQHLAIVEAMKMENVLRAERDGKVIKLLARVGETLAVDQPILEFE